MARIRLLRPDIGEPQAIAMARDAIARAADADVDSYLRWLLHDGDPGMPRDLVQVGTTPAGGRLFTTTLPIERADPLDYADIVATATDRGRGPSASPTGWVDEEQPVVEAAARALVDLEDEGVERPTLRDIGRRIGYSGEAADVSLSKALKRVNANRASLDRRALEIRTERDRADLG